jgi:hypothetical protein
MRERLHKPHLQKEIRISGGALAADSQQQSARTHRPRGAMPHSGVGAFPAGRGIFYRSLKRPFFWQG